MKARCAVRLGPFGLRGYLHGLDTVTATGAEVVVLPAASRATAVRTYAPFGTVVVSPMIV